MDIILVGLTALVITIVVGPVVLVSAGIHRQERAGSLTSQPSGLLALLTARVLGLHTCLPASPQSHGTAARRPPSAAGSTTGQVRS